MAPAGFAEKPDIPESVMDKWQAMADVLAKLCQVPAALIIKLHPSEIEVCAAAETDRNPYHPGEKAPLKGDLYCEEVMRTGAELLVPNALEDPRWDRNPDLAWGMVSYLGLPLQWSDGEIFGTICVLDRKANPYSADMRELLLRFKENVETYLALLWESHKRTLAERDLLISHEMLDQKVGEHTADLVNANQRLTREFARHKKTAEALEQNKRELEAIYDSAPLVMILLDEDRRIRKANRAAVQGTAIPADDIIGLRGGEALKCVHSVDDPRGCGFGVACDSCIVRNTVLDTLRTGAQHHRVESPLLIDRGDGPVQAHLLASTCLVDVAARRRVLVCIEDITTLKQTQELLVQTEKYKAVADLAAGVAHNFNNLLQVVLGNANLALGYLSSGDLARMRENLAEIIQSADSGAETVRRLHSFAFTGWADQRADIEVFDLSGLVRQALRTTDEPRKTSAEKRDIRIDLKEDLHEGCLIMGPRNKLYEVVVNLIRNAVEAMPHGGTLKLRTTVEHGRVVLRVQDSGVGIPEKELSRLFTPFVTTKFEGGTGLGLATGRQIVEAHGGRILVHSVEGKGSTFTVNLPLAEAPPVAAQGVPNTAPAGPLTILAIDDMPAAVKLLKTGLEKHSCKVCTAVSGEEGLQVFRENPVDLVVCDIGMPEMNGWEVGKAIKEICRERNIPKPPFMLLTGWGGQSEEKERIAESGVDAVVEKPITIPGLHEIIRGLVEGRLREESGGGGRGIRTPGSVEDQRFSRPPP